MSQILFFFFLLFNMCANPFRLIFYYHKQQLISTHVVLKIPTNLNPHLINCVNLIYYLVIFNTPTEKLKKIKK